MTHKGQKNRYAGENKVHLTQDPAIHSHQLCPEYFYA